MKEQDFAARTAALDELLGVERSFDMVGRSLRIGGRQARLWVVNGYAQDQMLERMIAVWLQIKDLKAIKTAQEFVDGYVSACEASAETERMKAVTAVFAGKTLLLIDGIDGGILMDAKHFPVRSVEEPDSSRVLRGSHDGFVESIMENAALLRRRIRDTELTLERLQISEESKTDIALCYLENKVDRRLLQELRTKLASIDVRSIAMSQESIAEAIAPRQWYNPFPKVRYTERPDVATASIMEGDILVMIDNSPAAMLLPVTIFRFAEDINDYYFPPLIGSYLKTVRLVVNFLTIFITPLWYLLMKSPDRLNEHLQFLRIKDDYFVPLIVQLLLVEFIVDILKLASLNTPNALSNAFSMLGALILGDFAVQSRWLVPEVLVYMAFVAVADYAQHSFELSYASKLSRMSLLILIFIADWIGFAVGVVGIVLLIATVKPLAGRGYLYPLIPFNGKDMKALLRRRPISRKNT